MSTFFAMGGYAWYIWMSYGVLALAVAVEIVALRLRRRAALAQAHAAEPEMSTFIRRGPAGSAE
jgi:heme exporter protein D